jgi:uncharacterized protein YabN with tetrapyrrole methylase and pyrophosphatase domain
VEELRGAVGSDDEEAVMEETGDLFFSLVNLSRHWGMNAEALLRSANQKFLNRFERDGKAFAPKRRFPGKGDRKSDEWGMGER